MKKNRSGYRWFVVGIFFVFMLLHQVDKLLIGPLTPQIIADFHLTNEQMGLVTSGALIIGTIFYPLWGYFYDRYARPKLLALASFIWGATTWMSSIAPTYPLFVMIRASTGIDDSSYPGLFSLIADYFDRNLRGKVYGLLQLTQPLGYLLGMILSLMIAPALGWNWRTVFIVTGSLGIILSIIIYFFVKEVPRGNSEVELEGVSEAAKFEFSWEKAKQIFRSKSMWFIFLQGFAGIFPWNVITYWFFTYLAAERGYDQNSILFTMAPVILILASGYFIGGALGDWLFKQTLNGRIIISSIGVLMGATFLYLAMTTPTEARNTFFTFMCIAAVFMPFSAANVTATVLDIMVPEIRSTAQSVESFIENSGAAVAPWLAGKIADAFSFKLAIIGICTTAWLLCFVLYLGVLFFLPNEIKAMRAQLSERTKA